MKQINFIPAELRLKQEIPGVLAPAVLFVVLCLYVGGSFISNFISTRSAENELSSIDNQNIALLKQIEGLSGSRQRLKLDQAIESMKKVLAKKSYLSGMFKELSILMPEGLWLTGFSHSKDNPLPSNEKGLRKLTNPDEKFLLIRGQATSPGVIAQFMTLLEKSKQFSGVQMKSSEREVDIEPERYNFEFAIPLKSLIEEGAK